jgi:uncharacterized membrane protein
MNVLLDNLSMIGVNSLLALIPIPCGWLMLKTRQKLLRLAFALLWFSFLPNTLYILTDLRYLPEQWGDMSSVGKLGLAVQYSIYELLGVSSFLLALYLLENTLMRSRWREHKVVLAFLFITVNFFMGFGMVLGRVQRLNSWDLFLDAPKVIAASFQIVSSSELLLLVMLFGVVANALYFVFRTSRGLSATLASKWNDDDE